MVMDFYRALVDMRRAALQSTDDQALYDEVCRIAVVSGHALMAWIGVARGDRVVPVAWAGSARQYTQGLQISLDRQLEAHQVFGPTAFAIAHGKPYVCNDFSTDERTQPWREHAARFGVGASVAYPIRRGGQTVGALNLYFRTAGSCDGALLELLEMMAADLDYALEHIDHQVARAKAEAASKEHEMRLANIIHVALEAIIILDSKFKIIVFNRSAVQMFGVPVEEAIGQHLDQLIPANHRALHRRHVAEFAATGKTARQMGNIRRVEALRSDGTVFPIEASISRVGDGQRAFMTVMIRDVSKLREAEMAHMARATAEAANREKTKFLSRISHEIRTPLNAIMGFAQLIQLDKDDPATPAQMVRLGHILKAGQHLCRLIEETLDVARIELGRIPIELVDIELGQLMDEVLNMCEIQAAQAGVHIDAAYRSSKDVSMRADPSRLRQVLLNLVSNAIKYNRRGGWVRLEVEECSEAVTITVRDNGIGMTSAQLAGLFDPFNRLGREASDIQGSGLGLVLARQLVELMEGELVIQSEAAIGTIASVKLPRWGQDGHSEF